MLSDFPEIGSKIRSIRKERNITLDEAAKLTGVSKTMLGQIERNESIPTISVLWKVAGGLRISMSHLLKLDSEELEPLNIEEIDVVYESDNKMELYPVFPFSPATGFEYFYIKLLPGAKHISGAHANATEEYLVVTEGTMTITVGESSFTLKAPMAFQFDPKVSHIYANPFDEVAIFQNIVKY